MRTKSHEVLGTQVDTKCTRKNWGSTSSSNDRSYYDMVYPFLLDLLVQAELKVLDDIALHLDDIFEFIESRAQVLVLRFEG